MRCHTGDSGQGKGETERAGRQPADTGVGGRRETRGFGGPRVGGELPGVPWVRDATGWLGATDKTGRP